MRLVLALSCCVVLLASASQTTPRSFQAYHQRVAAMVAQMMRNYAITYVYGGKQVKSVAACTACVQCLATAGKRQASLTSAAEKAQIKNCAACAQCSLDCSNFIHQVFNQVGLAMPYLTTKQMLQLSPRSLQKTWHLVTMPQQLRLIRPLDLLVYKGHVVMVETVDSKGRGTIVHVTAGRELRGPGVALQRERQVEFAHFRGPLLRILRHRRLITTVPP